MLRFVHVDGGSRCWIKLTNKTLVVVVAVVVVAAAGGGGGGAV